MCEGGGATNGDGSSSGLEESIALVAVSTKLVHSTSAIGRFGPPFVALIGEVRVVFLFTLLFEVDVSGLLEAVEILSRLFPSAWPPLPGEVRLELEMTVTGRAMWKAQWTSPETLSSKRAIFSRDRDFIKDNSDKVFFGSLDSGESLTPPFCWP